MVHQHRRQSANSLDQDGRYFCSWMLKDAPPSFYPDFTSLYARSLPIRDIHRELT
jgi:hypothetical protein